MSSLFWNKYLGDSSSKQLMVIFIGDSITFGANHFNPRSTAPPVIASNLIQEQLKGTKVHFVNCGKNGSTTSDFLPDGRHLFLSVQKAANRFLKYDNSSREIIFSIMLGTNDSARKGVDGMPVFPNQYQINMKTIINELLKLYPECKVVLQKPIWFSNNAYNGENYMQDALDRLITYHPAIDSLVKDYSTTKPNAVFLGDLEGFDHFKNNYLTDHIPEKGNTGTYYLHPNKKGAAKLGELWAKSILRVISIQ